MPIGQLRVVSSTLLVIGSCSLAGLCCPPACDRCNARGSCILLGLHFSFNAAGLQPDIHYYVVPCTQSPSTTISTSGPSRVTIGGKGFVDPATVSVPLVANQAVTVGAGGVRYTIRCLPADFPVCTAVQNSAPQGSGFLSG